MLQHCLRQRTLYRRDCRPLECHELTFGIDHLLLRLSTVEYWPRASRLSVLLPATRAVRRKLTRQRRHRRIAIEASPAERTGRKMSAPPSAFQSLAQSANMDIETTVAVGVSTGSTFPSGLAQALKQMGVVFRPKPRDAIVYIHIKCRRRLRDGLL